MEILNVIIVSFILRVAKRLKSMDEGQPGSTSSNSSNGEEISFLSKSSSLESEIPTFDQCDACLKNLKIRLML